MQDKCSAPLPGSEEMVAFISIFVMTAPSAELQSGRRLALGFQNLCLLVQSPGMEASALSPVLMWHWILTIQNSVWIGFRCWWPSASAFHSPAELCTMNPLSGKTRPHFSSCLFRLSDFFAAGSICEQVLIYMPEDCVCVCMYVRVLLCRYACVSECVCSPYT